VIKKESKVVSKILFQLDIDSMASSFDAVVAIDSGVDHLLSYGGVTPDNVTSLVHGAMFTRGGDNLRHTAIFIGGSDVSAAEEVAAKVNGCFFGPVRVSVLQDASGCNTTAAAAVISAAKHVNLKESWVCVLGGTGPVGRRVAEMISLEGARVRLVSRNMQRATEAASVISQRVPGSDVEPFSVFNSTQTADCLKGCNVVIACGAAGVLLLDSETMSAAESLRVAIDLNAVPPAGSEGIGAMDKANEVDGVIRYGALGVGGMKMKIHRAAIAALFERNDQMLDAKEVLAIGKAL